MSLPVPTEMPEDKKARFVASFTLPQLQFETTQETFSEDAQFWFFEYLTNALLALPNAKFEERNGQFGVYDYALTPLMLASLNNEATKRLTVQKKLQKARNGGILEV